ncbi:DUF333 domain-containing protein [Dickeya lacustris]|uniref:DUF333 domain-containing protein n=1 Tax=Dickeya lacustris TaxID=2259638 RepID=A0ABY8G8X3_9GAMM|nr:DUF333 domain-containing protein [Dickeya lacustris]WFN56406.1 DUF333 domain-containing protein [Dickeya lacustris]
MALPQWLIATAAIMLVACSSEPVDKGQNRAAVATPRAWQGQGTPADVNCMLAGGRMGLSRQLSGASIGTCLLANGKRCDETALLNGRCPAG